MCVVPGGRTVVSRYVGKMSVTTMWALEATPSVAGLVVGDFAAADFRLVYSPRALPGVQRQAVTEIVVVVLFVSEPRPTVRPE